MSVHLDMQTRAQHVHRCVQYTQTRADHMHRCVAHADVQRACRCAQRMYRHADTCTAHADRCSTHAAHTLGCDAPQGGAAAYPPAPPVPPTPCTPRPSRLGSHQVLAGRAGSPRKCRCQGGSLGLWSRQSSQHLPLLSPLERIVSHVFLRGKRCFPVF